jgi:cobalamin biosynthesis Mg chelatase CobN
VKWLALLLALAAARVTAATAYVSDELVLGVYAEQNSQGQRLTTLHSGAGVETLRVNGDSTEVRLTDGTTGWVKSTYLTTHEPATVRVKRLEEELDRMRATTPALAEAAARNEVLQLKRELKAKQSQLDDALTARVAGSGAATPGDAAAVGGSAAGAAVPSGPSAGVSAATSGRPVILVLAALIGLLGGFWLGYATLARRIKHKFGGVKVY